MLQPAKQTEALLLDLLSQWGGALTRLQADLPGQPALDGGIVCPCCKRIHGRCHEAAYPLMTLASRTGRQEYLRAAKKVFRWGENLLCPDGSMLNDAKSAWRGTTVFGAIALHDALFYHGALLSAAEKSAWEARLRRMGAWLYQNLRPGGVQAYLNYYAANACAMALLGAYFENAAYAALSRELAAFCLAHVSENGLLYGEGHPLDKKTAKGCRAIDAGGYNVEETLPCLTRCAAALGDGELLARCRALWRTHLAWMLPDGGWDNSAGARAFKWTYWGSRTSDGCQEALFLLGKTDPVFAAAALENASLYARCTHGGLLYGGPDYYSHGEAPCVHHTFCHAKALAGALNGGLYDFERVPLPYKNAARSVYWKELDVVRVTCGGWLADVSGYDHSAFPGDHASGGALSLLWHEKTGPLIACGAADYILKEPLNQQLPSDPQTHLCPCPRVEAAAENVRYAQYYDPGAVLRTCETASGVTVLAEAHLYSERGEPFPGDGACRLQYVFTENEFAVRGSAAASGARFILPLIGGILPLIGGILPLIGGRARVTVARGELCGPPKRFFNLNPGFAGQEFTVRPAPDGTFEIRVSV